MPFGSIAIRATRLGEQGVRLTCNFEFDKEERQILLQEFEDFQVEILLKQIEETLRSELGLLKKQFASSTLPAPDKNALLEVE